MLEADTAAPEVGPYTLTGVTCDDCGVRVPTAEIFAAGVVAFATPVMIGAFAAAWKGTATATRASLPH